MFSSLNFVDYIILISGGILCLKRVAQMERYHNLRVVVLTTILSFIVFFFFLAYGVTFGDPIYYDCPSPEHFCMTEM
jgi:uncharacterized membrane protein YesL